PLLSNTRSAPELYTLSLHDALPISATVSRVVNLFPASEQAQAVASVCESLVGIISQRLLVNAEGTAMVAAFEILANTLAVANTIDRKSTRLNSSHDQTSYAVFCLKK